LEKKESPGWHRGERYVLSAREENSASTYLQAIAAQFGIAENALVEIEQTVREHMRERALRLADDRSWIEVHANWARDRSPLTGRALQVLLGEDLARDFGQALHPILLEAARMYVEMLTKAIVEHRRQRKAIHWETISNRALGFCGAEADWEQSAEWLVKLFKTVNGADAMKSLGVRTRVTFETFLLSWSFVMRPWDEKKHYATFDEIALRTIEHIVHLTAPRENSDVSIKLPSLQELRYKCQIVIQRRAAEYLGCDPRTIRNYIRKGELTRAPGGKVRCDDDKFARKFLARRPAARVR
jgi:hypothetical protein